MIDRNGNWFQTYTGKKFFIFHPEPEEVDIQDIAHALSMQCRFNGHTNVFYSVAQHSIHVSFIFNKVVQGTPYEESDAAHLCALLHDAPEAYLGDMVRPLKRGLPEYKAVEDIVWKVILKRFGLEEVWPEVEMFVHEADQVMLATERRDLLPKAAQRFNGEWDIDEQHIEPDAMHIKAQPPEKIKQYFLATFHALTTGMKK